MDYFAIMPVDIFMDNRLSKTDLRVLGAIMSWRNKDTNLCHPSREQISERCGLDVSKVSTATTRLVTLGWLAKTGNGGRSMRCVYKFRVPELTVPDSGTVPDSVTVPDSGIKTVPDSGIKTVPDSGRGKELKENLNKLKVSKPTNTPDKFEVTLKMIDWAIENGVDENKIKFHTEQFLDRSRALGTEYKNWSAAWRTWMRNSVTYAARSVSK